MARKRKVTVKNQENVEPPKTVATVTKKAAEKPSKKQKIEPSFATGDGLNVVKIILSLQKSDCNSNKCMTELTKLYRQMDHKSFMVAFMKMTRLFLNRDEGDENALRVIKFIGHFVASFGEEADETTGESHAIIRDLFGELLTLTSNVIHVRSNLCQLVSNIMTSFSLRAEIDETIIEEITDRMLYMMKDISPQVRTQAVLALQRLQDPDISEDPVTKAYIYHMESDPATKVRQAVITSIAKKPNNMAAILERLFDVDDKVRRHTYLQMATFSVKTYKIADRIAILSTGLNDRSDVVRKSVTNILLSNWVGVYDYDYVELIKAIKLDSSEKDLLKFRKLAEQVLDEVFKKRKLSDMIAYLNLSANSTYKNCLPANKITLEMLLVWKCVVKYHQEYVDGRRKSEYGMRHQRDNDEDEDDEEVAHNETISNVEVLPELSVFCDFLENYVDEYKIIGENEKLQKNYLSQNITVLLEIAQLNDMGDELGKERLQMVLKKILLKLDISEHPIQETARIMEKVILKVDARLEFFNEIVNEMVRIGTPSEYSRQSIIEDLINKSDIDRKLKANQLKLHMMELKEQETVFAERKQYADCQKVSDEYAKKNEELIELLIPIAETHSVSSVQSLMQLKNLSSTTVKKITPAEVIKNLQICYFAINTKGVKTIAHEVHNIYKEFVSFHLESTDVYTRIWALKTATAYSLLYDALAHEIYFAVKKQIFSNPHVLIWECAIQCIIDLLLRYSMEKLEKFDLDGTNASLPNQSQNRSRRGGARTLYTDDDGEDGEEADPIEQLRNLDVTKMLMLLIEQNVDKRIYKVSIIGICKLILHGVYCTRDIISKFMLMYFNPATDPEINQILGNFLENIVKRKKQEFIHDALVPTIVTLLEAPHDSPLREVKLETVLKYIVGATRPIFCSNGLNLHNTLGMQFLDFMRENSDNKDILKTFSKELIELEVSEDPVLKRDMTKQVEIILKESTADPRTKKYLTDFKDMLNGTYRVPLKFSSTARTTSATIAEEEEGLEKIDEDEEEVAQEEEKLETVAETLEVPETKEEEEKDSSKTILSPTKKKLLDVSSSLLTISTPKTNRTITNETQSEEIEIPGTPEHIELPATQTLHVELPATQQIDSTKVDDSDDDDVMEVSMDESIPPTPVTPMTVKPKRQQASTPNVSANKKAVNAKRVLEISRSTPTTPSVSSPMRKTRKVPQSATTTPTTSGLTLTTSTPRTNAKEMAKTPISEGRLTRKQAKEEIAQNNKLTRSASKALNVKPSAVTEKSKPQVKEDEKKAPKPSKLPVKKTTVAPRSQPQNATRQLRTRTNSQPTTTKQSAENKANSSRPPWK